MTNQEIQALQTLLFKQEKRLDAIVALLKSKSTITKEEADSLQRPTEPFPDTNDPLFLGIQAEWRSLIQGLGRPNPSAT